MAVQGFRIPRIECEGTWSLVGYEIAFETPQPATLPLGSRLVTFVEAVSEEGKETTRKFAPTEESVMRIYSVAEGDVLKDSDPLASGNLLTKIVGDGRKNRKKKAA